jgi:hypothetical protein
VSLLFLLHEERKSVNRVPLQLNREREEEEYTKERILVERKVIMNLGFEFFLFLFGGR